MAKTNIQACPVHCHLLVLYSPQIYPWYNVIKFPCVYYVRNGNPLRHVMCLCLCKQKYIAFFSCNGLGADINTVAQ